MGLLSDFLSNDRPAPDPAAGEIASVATTLLDEVGLGVSVYRLDTPGEPESFRLVYSNAASGRITGLDVQAEVGKRLVDVAPGVRELGLLDVYAGVITSGEPADLGRVAYEGDGRVASGTYQIDAVPLPGDMVGVVFENVSDRVEVRELASANTELARQESRFRSLIDATAAVVWTTSPTGELVGDQSGWQVYTGQTPDQYAGAGWLDAIHPDDRDATHAAWEAAVENRSLYAVKHRLRRADGVYRTMQVRGVPVLRDGEVMEWVGIHTDVEEQEVAALALAESETRMRTLFDAVSDVLLVYPSASGQPGPLRYVNRAAVETYGYPEAELLQMTVADLIDPESVDVAAGLAELRRTRQATFESVHRTRDGRKIPMRTNARLVELDGEIHVVALARDDTEGRQFRREMGRANLDLERRVEARTAQLEAYAEDLRILHGISTADYATPEEGHRAYLEAGCQMFDLPIGILSATPKDLETGDYRYRIEAVVSPDPELRRGLEVPLSQAFCDAVIAREETVTYGDACAEAPDHPACSDRGLRAFIGAPIRIDGEIRGTLNFVSPEPRPRGFAPHERDLIEVMADVVGRRIRAEQATSAEAEAELRSRSIVETVSEGVVLVSPTGDVLTANPRAHELLGLSEDGATRWPVVDADGMVLHYADLPEREVFRTGQPSRGQVHGILHPDGTTHWLRVNATPIDHDADGVPEAVVVSFSDITDIQNASATARRTRAVLASVLDASPDGVMAFRAVRSADGTIEDFEWLLANARSGDIVGRDPETLIGRKMLDEFPGNAEAGLFDAYARVVETGERFETLVTYPHDGLDTTFRITATAIETEDGFTVTFAEVLPAEAVAVEPDA